MKKRAPVEANSCIWKSLFFHDITSKQTGCWIFSLVNWKRVGWSRWWSWSSWWSWGAINCRWAPLCLTVWWHGRQDALNLLNLSKNPKFWDIYTKLVHIISRSKTFPKYFQVKKLASWKATKLKTWLRKVWEDGLVANELGVDNSDPSKTNPPFIPDSSPLSSNKSSTHCGGALVNFLLSPQPNPISSLQFNLQTSHWKFHKFPTAFLTAKTTLNTNMCQRISIGFPVSIDFNWFSKGLLVDKRFSFVEPALVWTSVSDPPMDKVSRFWG